MDANVRAKQGARAEAASAIPITAPQKQAKRPTGVTAEGRTRESTPSAPRSTLQAVNKHLDGDRLARTHAGVWLWKLIG